MKGIPKIITILSVGIGSSILLYVLVVSPLLSEVNIINADVRNKKAELEVLRQQISAFKAAQSDLARATRKEEIINAIPVREDLVNTVLDLERAAELTGSEHLLQIFEPVDPKKDKKYKPLLNKKAGIEEVPYRLNVNNDFAGLVNFLSYVEHLPHFTELSKLQLNSVRAEGTDDDTLSRTGRVSSVFDGVFFIQTK